MSDISIPGSNSNADIQRMIEQLMEIERAPRVRAQERVDDLLGQKSAWQDLNRRMISLREASKQLFSFQNPFNTRVATSSDESALTATASREAAGETIDFPIISSNKEGLTPIEYFITTHGARKGMTDTALNTAKAGYLTRKLFDVSQDCLITEEDCGSRDGVVLSKITSSGIEVSIAKIAKGRFLADVMELEDKNSYHIINYNSPGATGAPAYSAIIVKKLQERGFLDYTPKLKKSIWDFDTITI